MPNGRGVPSNNIEIHDLQDTTTSEIREDSEQCRAYDNLEDFE
jgi:hypothetical protein